MYPVSSVIGSVAASSVVTESGNDTSNNASTTQGDDLQPVDVTTSGTAVGHVVSTRSKDKTSANKYVTSVAVSSSAASTYLSPMTETTESEPGSLSKTHLQSKTQLSSSSTTATLITATTVGKESTMGRAIGKAIAQKPVTSTVVSPSAATVSQIYGTSKPSQKRELKKLSDVSSEDFSRAIDAAGVPIVEFSIGSNTLNLSRKRAIKSNTSATIGPSSCGIRFRKILPKPDPVVFDQHDSVSATANVPTIVTLLGGTGSSLTSDILSLLGVTLSPESVRVIEGLFFKVNEFSRCIYSNTVRTQLLSSVSNKLTVTGYAIWYCTYRVMCEDIFVFKCLAEYHANHRPGFIRALPDIKILSDSPDRNIVPLVGDSLLGFLSKLDCAVLSKVKSVFKSDWDKAVSEVYVALREESLNAVSCKDLIGVLDTAGIPSLAFTGLTRSLHSSSQPLLHRSNHKLSPRARAQSKSQLSSVGDSAGRFSFDQCVDLLDVKLHPDSAEIIYKLFFNVRKSARIFLSMSMLNHILTTVSSKLSAVGKAIWCKTYKELHLSRFMYRSICMYHAKYRPDFIRDLGSVRVLSSCRLVPLNGGELLGFLSRLDCAIHEIVDSVFNLWWDEVANRVFAELEAESLSNVNCGDFITVLDVVGVPAVAFSISQSCVKVRAIAENRTSESSSKCAVEATESGSSTIDLTHSSVTSFSQLQSQKESSLPFVTDSVAVPTLSGDSFLAISGDVLVPTVDVSASALGVGDELSVEPSSELEVAADILSSSASSVREDRVGLTAVDVAPAFWGLGDRSLSLPSSPSILPSSSSSSSFSSSSPSESGLYADVSSSSPESLELFREVALTTEGIASASSSLVGESTHASSSEQLIVPITTSSSVSTAIGESSTAASSSSSSYVHGPKKLLIMRFEGTFEASTTSNVAAGPSYSAPVVVDNVPLVAAATDTTTGDVGVRLAALLNRELPPLPPPASESSGSMRGGRGRLSSSHRGSAQRGRGRKRKRNS
ncbi:hypothetical protein [Candidatus Ichthyocystis sparus]|uniref:hypothetical protein n=1 Tax=Candidatus Ichthyocystis sparus TaxID=1561004 RepID=UPI000B89835E|nr:hypothetical protein [Candidatus Ichthyocystis sparus]